MGNNEMNFEEYAAKPILAAAGIKIPKGQLASTPDEAENAARKSFFMLAATIGLFGLLF